MKDIDRAYFARRVVEERQRAERSRQPEIQRVHVELAERYEALLRPVMRIR